MDFNHIVDWTGKLLEGAGVAVIVLGAAIASAIFLYRLTQTGAKEAYHDYRHLLGRAILLGLEFLVAGDIIRTVAVEPTMNSVLVLAVIVLIRTFLSLTLELELEGRWPWQRGRDARTD